MLLRTVNGWWQFDFTKLVQWLLHVQSIFHRKSHLLRFCVVPGEQVCLGILETLLLEHIKTLERISSLRCGVEKSTHTKPLNHEVEPRQF